MNRRGYYLIKVYLLDRVTQVVAIIVSNRRL
jgi:hypothetical protein